MAPSQTGPLPSVEKNRSETARTGTGDRFLKELNRNKEESRHQRHTMDVLRAIPGLTNVAIGGKHIVDHCANISKVQ